MAYQKMVPLEGVFDSFDAAEEMFSSNLQKAKENGRSDDIIRYEGALEAIKWMKYDNQYEIWKSVIKKRKSMES